MCADLGEQVTAVGIVALVVLLISLIIYGLAHPLRHAALLIVLATCIAPILLIVLVYKAGLRGLLKRDSSVDPKSVKGLLLRNPFIWFVLPAYVPIILWMILFFMIFEKDWRDYAPLVKRHILLITSLVTVSEVSIAYLFVMLHATYLGVYAACCLIYTSLSIPLGGLSIEEDGALGFFGKYKQHASPLVVLCFALGCAAAFSILHYTVWSIWPNQYVNLHGIEDAFYFSVVTMATVGYGDIVPVGHVARALCLMEIICGVVLLVVGVAASMSVWVEINRPGLAKNPPTEEKTPQP